VSLLSRPKTPQLYCIESLHPPITINCRAQGHHTKVILYVLTWTTIASCNITFDSPHQSYSRLISYSYRWHSIPKPSTNLLPKWATTLLKVMRNAVRIPAKYCQAEDSWCVFFGWPKSVSKKTDGRLNPKLSFPVSSWTLYSFRGQSTWKLYSFWVQNFWKLYNFKGRNSWKIYIYIASVTKAFTIYIASWANAVGSYIQHERHKHLDAI